MPQAPLGAAKASATAHATARPLSRRPSPRRRPQLNQLAGLAEFPAFIWLTCRIAAALERHPVLRRASEHTMELAIGLGWAIVALAYLTSPANTLAASPVGAQLPGILFVTWAILELVGGLAIVLGIFRNRIDVRAGGLIILAGGLFMHATAATGAGLDVRDAVYWVQMLACAIRGLLIYITHAQRPGR